MKDFSLSVEGLFESRFEDVEIVEIQVLDNIGIVGFEIDEGDTFGVGSYKKIGPIYIFNDGGTYSKNDKNDMVNWVGGTIEIKKSERKYTSFIKVNDKKIEYVLIGARGLEKYKDVSTLKEMEKYRESYLLEKVKNGFFMFVYDNSSIGAENIMLFDSKGSRIR